MPRCRSASSTTLTMRRSRISWRWRRSCRLRRCRRATSARASPRSARSGRPVSAGAEEAEHLPVLGEPVLPLLREARLAVDDHVVLALRPLACGRLEAVLDQLGRETRGPSVVAASDGAVEDLDGHDDEPTLGARWQV